MGEPAPTFAAVPSDARWTELKVGGMHCGGCVRRVSQALASVEGVVVNDVRVGAARLTSKLDPPPVDLAIAALVKAGYGAHLEQ